jgi:hypothetical protein
MRRVTETRISENPEKAGTMPNLSKHQPLSSDEEQRVQESLRRSRILQVSIFQTLQNSLTTVDFSLLLIDVMTIADEVDSQLKQTIVSFTEQVGISAATAI